MYAYEVQNEDECVNCFYPTVNKCLGRDNKDLLHCIVLYCIRRPDMTFAVDWALNINYLSIYLLYCIVLYCIALIALRCVVLYCIVSYRIALHCIALYCIVLF